MSYTMTLDVPDRTAAYVERRGPRYRAELNAIFVAIVAANMQSDEAEARRDGFEWPDKKADETSEENGEDILDQLSGIVKLPPGFDDKSIRAEAALEKYDGISPRVQSLCGIVSLPPDFDEKEFKAARLAERCGV